VSTEVAPLAAAPQGAGFRRRRILVVALFVAALIGLGAAGYYLGRSGGSDVDAARARGHKEGVSLGYAIGTHRGFQKGFSSGRTGNYDSTYRRGYESAYRQAYRDFGLQPPREVPPPGP
jgi:hypothetical protein